MKTTIETTCAIDEQGLRQAIEALQPSRLDMQKRAFKKFYPLILDKLAEGVKDSDIIKALAQQGIVRSRNTYVKWMAEMRQAAEPDAKHSSAIQDAMQCAQDDGRR